MSFLVYEMQYEGDAISEPSIACAPFERKYFGEYREIYNDCFYEMRKSLDIRPYEFLSEFRQIEERGGDIFLLLTDGKITGSVTCRGNEIDDVIVRKNEHNKGYGRQLLLWGICRIREKNHDPITLHVAAWNEKAVRLYERTGFRTVKTETVDIKRALR